jgi:SAM-dependent methyltransferase
MTPALELRSTRCAICGTEGNAEELYAANFDLEALSPELFSARRLPDRIHYRLVRCNACGLVRSDPVAPLEVVAQLYQQSSFTYTDEVADLKRTYGRYLAELEKYGTRKGALLEIGCGNGFFLQQALAQGYRAVRGVEPSQAAVSQAAPEVRGAIVCDLMRPGLFTAHGFRVRKVGSARNRYSLRYLVRLLPLPAGPKRALFGWLQRHAFGGLRLCLPLGNLYLVAERAASVPGGPSRGS